MTEAVVGTAMRELTADEIAAVAGGFEEEYKMPEDGSDPEPRFSAVSGSGPAYVNMGWRDDVRNWVIGFLTDLGVLYTYDQINAQEQWEQTTVTSQHTHHELALGQWHYNLATGQTSATNYSDIPMNAVYEGVWQGTYYDGFNATMFISTDADGDSVIDHVYMHNSADNEWFVATHTDASGNPIWQPTTDPRDDEDFPKPPEQETE